MKNGTLSVQRDDTGDLTEAQTQSLSTDVKLAQGDYLEARVFQDSGGDIFVQDLSFSMSWVAPG
jgi:hypothetical protein